MDDNIGNDEITESKQQDNYEKDLDSGIKNVQDAHKHGQSFANKIKDTKNNHDDKGSSQSRDGPEQSSSKADNTKETAKSNDYDNRNKSSDNAPHSDSPNDKGGSSDKKNSAKSKPVDNAGQKTGEQTGGKAAEEAGKQTGKQSGQKVAEKAAEKTAEKVAEKVAEKAAEAGATAAGTAIAPGIGTLVGKAVGKTIVPLVKMIIVISVFGGLLLCFIMQSLPSYIFNPSFGLNPNERKISDYKDLKTPELVYSTSNKDVMSDLNSAKTKQKLNGSASMDMVFLYSCYSASQNQYAICPTDENTNYVSYKVDMVLKIIKVLPKVLVNQVINSTNTANNNTSSGATATAGDTGGGDYTLGSITQLVNKYHAIDSSYVPTDLEETCDSNGRNVYLRSEANQAFTSMFNDATSRGLVLVSTSGYRSYELQQSLYGDGNDNTVAKPGESEHQLGLALDISSPADGGGLTEGFASTPEGQYLAENAAQYGFIIRYPKGKEAYTGYPYEPWHVRYVGVAVAQAIKASGLTMEGYYAQQAGQTVSESTTQQQQNSLNTVTPFKKELFFTAFFGDKVKLTDKMENSSSTYEEYISYLGEAMKKMLKISDGNLTLGNGRYGGIYAWPLDKPLSEYQLADDDDWGWRVHPITGDVTWHDGVDLSDPEGSNVYSAQNGTVEYAGVFGGYGNYIRIDHGNGVETFYGHLSAINVTEGQTVTKGQLIGLVGSTGDSTGAHLHFGAIVNGESFDPLQLYTMSNNLSDSDYNDLLRIVQAEAGGQGFDGKVAVTQVIMYRVQVTGASYHDVIFADGQFSPISDGRFYTVEPDDETTQAVNAALNGTQVVNPHCYYFYNPDASGEDWSGDSDKIFDRRIGDHCFYLSANYQ